ncbi:MAG: lipid-A-disaccharide synthase [Gemmatimonadetes bacterium]|nr:lipid-A-disaccharide synthase [Gemmatimonadota bacterium]NNK49795.1 lipid-A-disaccharide synthase [Gemmatimonadota bacterium]
MSDRSIFLAAGEPSGDLHGAELARELKRQLPGVRLYGLGGSLMAAEGVELLADLDRLAILGFAEVVRHLPDLASLRREVRRFLVERDVDLLVPIDYPGFNLPLARYSRRKGISVLYYIAPQVWAWHESRARKLARDTDLVCVVLPFEEERLQRWGVRTRFVGHPLLDGESPEPTGAANEGNTSALGLFPGSREQEVARLLPIFLDAGRRLSARVPGLEVLVARARDLPVSAYGDIGDAALVDPESTIRRAGAAITKSGTITLQLALAGVPMVVGYKVNPLTYTIARRLVRVDHIALVNLVADRRLVPEFIQADVTSASLAAAALPLLTPGSSERGAQVRGLQQVADRLGEPGAAARVARECSQILDTRATK